MLNLWFPADNPGYQPRNSGLFLCAFLLTLSVLLPADLFAQATLDTVSGKVMVRAKGTSLWNQVTNGFTLKTGDSVKTRRASKTTLQFEDGSKVEVGAKSFFILQAAAQKKKSIQFNWGRMKAIVRKAVSQRFSVRTPTAVCSVRGTEFEVSVQEGSGNTQVNLMAGLLGVADQKGNEVLLRPGESIGIDQQGLGKPGEQGKADGSQSLKDAIKKEVGLEMTKEEIQAAAALEMKNAVYKDGKALVDVNGNRVRVESYIVRSAANQFKLVILNSRVERFDYFFYKGTFNTTLPDNLRDALVQVNGCIGTACTWFLTERERAASNLTDVYRVVETGGHLVDVNNNADVDDNVTAAVDFATGELTTLSAGTPFFKNFFDEGNTTFNGVSHNSWQPNLAAAQWVKNGGAGIQSYNTDIQDNTTITPAVTKTSLKTTGCATADNCTGFKDPEKFQQVLYSENGDGSVWDRFENSIINDKGEVVSRSSFPSDAANNALFKKNLLEVNYEMIITASEFAGRKIDLVVTPRILIDSGLIP